ncbi:NYN domain-containing protein [Actinomyces marmotae]|uniref:NYN domain-containing protein n=1 Tax=Actinomyces marmotae TaxID=2737173 RepID=A0A6M8B1I3_9ACTO|nr:NYN domain-containing protein [Actinomyces marmotae]QKD80148.1 NYN domain-containing protein [Actinomyces marmotae]
MDRVAVFFDYQNVAGWAKRCFNVADGHIWPKATAELLVSRRHRPSQLVDTRVYRGRPNPARQDVSARANDRQAADWEATGVTVVRRNLQYPPQWPDVPASEKGIDVALAVDLVKHAMKGSIDAAIVFTSDKDILPAIELVYNETPCHVELACWRGGRRLHIDGTQRPWCHFLAEADFLRVQDPTDYAAPDLPSI